MIWRECRGIGSAGPGLMRCQGVPAGLPPFGLFVSVTKARRSLLASSRRRPRRLAAHVQCAPVQLPCHAKRLAVADSGGCWEPGGRGRSVQGGPHPTGSPLVRRGPLVLSEGR